MTMGYTTEEECKKFIRAADLIGWYAMPDDPINTLWWPVPDHGAPALTLDDIVEKANKYFAS